MQPIVLKRHADVDLHFTGELIAELSSHRPGRQNWEEIRIWRTDESTQTRWVVENIAKTTRRGQNDLIRTFKCKTPYDVRNALRKKDPETSPARWFLTDMAFAALDAAVMKDPRIEVALIEKV